jgi:indole-3-glycerol phosphate synthase
LVEILEEKQREVARLKKRGLPAGSEIDELEIRDFKGAISTQGRIELIAEIKFASPSAGVICEKSDTLEIGRMYNEAGAAAISLLTDEKFFRGRLKDLTPLRNAVSLPVLRKDFIIHEIQVRESSLFGADAILLIVRILSMQQLKDLLASARELGLAVLTEIHDKADLERAIECGADIIGINNRDLDTFEVNINTTLELAPLVPKEYVVVSESGISAGGDIGVVKRCGVRAVLVGTSIMKSRDPAEKVRELVEAGRLAFPGQATNNL